MQSHPQPSVCVYCGSRPGADPAFAEAAAALGRALAEAGFRLVYGAGDVGLMGRVAQAGKEAGGSALGVIPRHLGARERGRRDLTTLVVTETMHERKKVMFMNAEAIVALPGGAGTLDELFEVLTWRQLGLHSKPVFVLNTGGYWNPLLGLLEHMVAQGFAERSFLGFLEAQDTVPALIARLRETLAPCPLSHE